MDDVRFVEMPSFSKVVRKLFDEVARCRSIVLDRDVGIRDLAAPWNVAFAEVSRGRLKHDEPGIVEAFPSQSVETSRTGWASALGRRERKEGSGDDEDAWFAMDDSEGLRMTRGSSRG